MDRHGMTVTVMPIDIPGKRDMYRVIISRNMWRGSKCVQSSIDMDITMRDQTFCQPGTKAHSVALLHLVEAVYQGYVYGETNAGVSGTNPYPPVASDTPTEKM